jgi:mono/diheme cytochrome c family protein
VLLPSNRSIIGGGAPTIAGNESIKPRSPCINCHVIPGIPDSRGLVGPPLSRWAGRAYIGGRLPNTPETLVQWIRDAPSFDPEVAMPDMGISDQDARDMAAYLFTLN